MKIFAFFIFLTFSFCVFAQVEDVVPARPNPPRLFNDYTNTLTPEQAQALENKLVAFSDSTSNQIAVVIVKSLEGYGVADYAFAVGRKWGVGGAEFSNGIVLLVAKDDRKTRIEVGYGLEGAIPDVSAKSIIDRDLTPNFRNDEYYRGIDQATDNLMLAAAGRYKVPAKSEGKSRKIRVGGIIFFIVLLLIFMSGGRGGRGRKGGMMSRRGYHDVGTGWLIGSILSGMTRGGGGGWTGGGGGGGGFGGFGGGSFGGGGASGSW